MPRRDTSAEDAQARAMGLATIDELAGTDPREQRFAQDMDALRRNLYDLPALGEREPLTDPMADDPTHVAVYGKSTGPSSMAELSQRWDEWESLARRAAYEEPVVTERAPADAGQDDDEEIAERLWGGFRSAYPALAGDEKAVESAAATVMERGGFKTEREFIDAVADELNTGRTVGLTPSPSAKREGEREGESDMLTELHTYQRKHGLH